MLILWLELHSERRHAVNAAEVAAISQGDTQVGHSAAKRVPGHTSDRSNRLANWEQPDWADRGTCRHHPCSPLAFRRTIPRTIQSLTIPARQGNTGGLRGQSDGCAAASGAPSLHNF